MFSLVALFFFRSSFASSFGSALNVSIARTSPADTPLLLNFTSSNGTDHFIGRFESNSTLTGGAHGSRSALMADRHSDSDHPSRLASRRAARMILFQHGGQWIVGTAAGWLQQQGG
jgi:hypothetical protein